MVTSGPQALVSGQIVDVVGKESILPALWTPTKKREEAFATYLRLGFILTVSASAVGSYVFSRRHRANASDQHTNHPVWPDCHVFGLLNLFIYTFLCFLRFGGYFSRSESLINIKVEISLPESRAAFRER